MGRLLNRRVWLLVFLTAVAGTLRLWSLDRIPPGFHYDEAFEALEAWRVLVQPGYHPIFFPGNFGVEPIFIYLTSLAFRVFGAGPVVMRGVAALLGTLTVAVVFGLGRELVRYEPRLPAALPWLGAGILALLRWHLLFSRVGIEPILVPLCLAGMLWAFWRGLRTNGPGAWLAAGALAGLGPYTYPAGRLLLLLLPALAALVYLLDRPRFAGRGRGLALAAGTAVLVVAPLAWHFIRYPDQLLLRSSQIALSPEGAARVSIWQNFLAVLGMFSLRGDRDPRSNLPGLPALDVWLSVPFYLGLIAAAWRWRRAACSGLLLSLALMLVPTILSEHAPHFRRALGATPAVALLCGLGLGLILEWGARAQRVRASSASSLPGLALKIGSLALVIAVVAASGYLSVRDYFARWGRSPGLYYAYDQGLWEIGRYVASLPPGQSIYISPRPASDMTLAFAWRNGPAVRHFDGRRALVAPAYPPEAGGQATYIVIEHEDYRGGGMLAELYPQAREVQRFLDRRGKVYARAWQLTSSGPAARRPEHAIRAAWPGATLMGYDLHATSFHPGDTLYLQLWWRATAPVATDWTVFTHLLGPPKDAPAGERRVVWAGQDSRPGGGSAPTTGWRPGDLVLDEYQIHVPDDALPGQYALEAGLYDPARGGVRGLTTDPAAQDHVILGRVTVQ